MINALKWLVKFLETRFPEKTAPASVEQVNRLVDALEAHEKVVFAQKQEIEKIQKHIEILNLRVGLTRATQAPFGRKLNG